MSDVVELTDEQLRAEVDEYCRRAVENNAAVSRLATDSPDESVRASAELERNWRLDWWAAADARNREVCGELRRRERAVLDAGCTAEERAAALRLRYVYAGYLRNEWDDLETWEAEAWLRVWREARG